MSAAFAIRDEMNDIEEAPGKVWFWELERAVIDAGRCIECGACIAACPSDSLGIGADDMPTLVKMCTGCSLCWDFCPRGGLRYEATPRLAVETEVEESRSREVEKKTARRQDGKTASAAVGAMPASPASPTTLAPLSPAAPTATATAVVEDTVPLFLTGQNGHNGNGHHESNGHNGHHRDSLSSSRERYTARVKETIPGVQDGGIVTALLASLLEAGEIDGALVAKPSAREPWKGVAHLARSREELIACAGSFYNQTLALGHLDFKKYDLPQNPRIALVGTPCEIQGLRAMQARPFYWGASKVDAVVLTVALMCTKSFDYEGLMLREIQEKRAIKLHDVSKIDIIRGKLLLYGNDGETILDEPIRDFHGAALKGCDECADFLGLAADISVGSVGSADGYSSVVIWTKAGQAAFQQVAPELEIRDLDKPQSIEKLAEMDKSTAFAKLPRPYDPEAPLFIDYAEHLRHYAETDRAPVTHEPVRY